MGRTGHPGPDGAPGVMTGRPDPDPDALGVEWPLTLYVCVECARPTMFKEDRCCAGLVATVEVVPLAFIEAPS